MVAPVHVKDDSSPNDENDLATPAKEINSRNRIDRRSLLPPRPRDAVARNATSVSVGFSKPALYRHFYLRDEVFQSIASGG
jgi:hypothetical protein